MLTSRATVVYGQAKDRNNRLRLKMLRAKSAATDRCSSCELKERRARARSLLDLALKRRTHVSTIKHCAPDRSRELLTRSGKSMLNKVDCCFAKHGKPPKLPIRRATENFRKRFSQQKARTGGGYAINLPPNMRREVLRLAARHDRALGEEFLEKLKAQKARSRKFATIEPRPSQRSFEPAFIGGDENYCEPATLERALQFAEPALAVVSMESINFL